jgi:hypothetical protein
VGADYYQQNIRNLRGIHNKYYNYTDNIIIVTVHSELYVNSRAKLNDIVCSSQWHHAASIYIIFLPMYTDYPDGAGVQQPQSPPAELDALSQSLTFSKDMSNEQLALWLRNHPSLSGTDYKEDIGKLRGTHAACYSTIVLLLLLYNVMCL